MIDTNDPIITALQEHENKLDWDDRKDVCPRRPIVCAAYRVAAFVETLFQSMIAYVRSVGN